ncbi:hypothetical protein OV208_30380 [Corallococcus sp. bb12-1]|uniref:hypothetical protein n=1 Tax=Corallococcus sp. bb12-1 TaxID=2996784 RepID=UPI00226DC14F|nr:hypothetical protein [Corallococcus sp. bb12-1]MCY1045662.1 hypothetical protein [Corallococcus sp. bb12-1]
MRHVFVALAAMGLLATGCGSSAGSEDSMLDTGSVKQELTPCMANCYAGCTGGTVPVNQCKAECRAECAGS